MINLLKQKEKKSNFTGKFLCHGFSVFVASSGKSYLNFKMQDSEGVIAAKKWDLLPGEEAPKDGVYLVTGVTDEYKGQVQANVRTLKLEENDVAANYAIILLDEQSLIDYTERFKASINLIGEPKLKELVSTIYRDLGLYSGDIRLTPLYTTAALRWHHVGSGGFIMHTVNTTTKVYYMSMGCVETVNRDLAVAASLLHDIGKVFTYKIKDGAFVMTQRGQTLDHLVLGIVHLEKYRCPENDGLVTALQGILAGHHQTPEMGTVRPPFSLETWLVTFADQLDCKEFTLMEKEAESPEYEDMFRIGSDFMFGAYGMNSLLQYHGEEFADMYYQNSRDASVVNQTTDSFGQANLDAV